MVEVFQHFASPGIAQARRVFLLRMASETLDFLFERFFVRELLLLPKAKQGQQKQD